MNDLPSMQIVQAMQHLMSTHQSIVSPARSYRRLQSTGDRRPIWYLKSTIFYGKNQKADSQKPQSSLKHVLNISSQFSSSSAEAYRDYQLHSIPSKSLFDYRVPQGTIHSDRQCRASRRYSRYPIPVGVAYAWLDSLFER